MTTKLSRPAWVKKHREHSGIRTHPFDFKRMLEREKITVEQLASAIGYSIPGVMYMIARGTIKPRTLEALRKKFSRADTYIRRK